MWAWITGAASTVAGWFMAANEAVAAATIGVALGWVAIIIVAVIVAAVIIYMMAH